MTIIRRVVSAARPTVDTFFETLSTGLTNTVDTILGKSGEGEDKSLPAILLRRLHYTASKLIFHRHGELIAEMQPPRSNLARLGVLGLRRAAGAWEIAPA